MKLIIAFPKVIHVPSSHFQDLFMDLTHIAVAERFGVTGRALVTVEQKEQRETGEQRERKSEREGGSERERERETKIHACKDVDLRLRSFTVMWKRSPFFQNHLSITFFPLAEVN